MQASIIETEQKPTNEDAHSGLKAIGWIASFLGLCLGRALGQYFIGLIIPIALAFCLFWVLKNIPTSPSAFRAAWALQAAQLLWIAAAALLSGKWPLAAPDIAILVPGLVWLWLRPGLGPFILLSLYQLVATTINLWLLVEPPEGTDERAQVANLCIRTITLGLLYVGYSNLRNSRSATHSPVNASSQPTPNLAPTRNQASSDCSQPPLLAVARPEMEAPSIYTKPQWPDEPPRQISAMGRRLWWWNTRKAAIGLTIGLTLVAGVAAIWLLRHPSQSQAKAVRSVKVRSLSAPEPLEDLRRRAEMGDAKAQYNLGRRYYDGRGVQQSYSEAAKWYRNAADQGDANAQFSLGRCYMLGKGVPQDFVEAGNWSRRAAEQGSASGQYLYYLVCDDRAEAAGWLRKSADQGYSRAQCEIGRCYLHGTYVQKDYAQAAKWMHRAANQRLAAAQYNLGILYRDGAGVPQNDIEAYKWLSLATAQGYTGSAENRDWVAQRMSRAEVVEGQRRASAFVATGERGSSPSEGALPTPRGGGGSMSAGTGFFVTDDGYFVTCEHVVRGASSFHVKSPNGSFPARLIKKNRTIDVAVLKVDGAFRALPVAAQPRVKLGEAVFTIGFPNTVVQGVEPKLTRGEISSMAGIRDNPRYFQISVPVQPGNSGGPLVDESGNAVGVVTSRLDDVATYEISGALPQNVNYAVKSSVVYDFLSRIPELSGKVKVPHTAKDRQLASVAAEQAAMLVVAE